MIRGTAGNGGEESTLGLIWLASQSTWRILRDGGNNSECLWARRTSGQFVLQSEGSLTGKRKIREKLNWSGKVWELSPKRQGRFLGNTDYCALPVPNTF